MALGPYNQGTYNDGIYNFPDVNANVSIEFNGVNDYLENTVLQSLGVANLWTITLWLKPFETLSIYDADGRAQFRPDGKALLHFKGETHRSELLIWGDRVENSNSEEFIVVENWDESTERIRITRFNMAQKRKEWRMFSCAWDGSTLIGANDGVLVTDAHQTLAAAGTMSDSDRGRSVRIAAAYSGTARSLDSPRVVAYSGLLGPVGVWDTVVDPVQLGTLASGAFTFDLTADASAYTSSANLQHWWRLGFNTSDFGRDYTAVGTPIDVATNATVVSGSIISDSP